MTEQQLQSVMSQNIAQAAASQSLTLQKAEQLAELVLKRAAEMGVNAVVAVADSSGNPVLCKRADHAFLASWDIALGKAYTVTALKMSTAKLSVLAAPGGELYGIQSAAASRCKAVTARWLAGWALAGVQKVRIPRFPNTEPKFLNNYKEMRLLQ